MCLRPGPSGKEIQKSSTPKNREDSKLADIPDSAFIELQEMTLSKTHKGVHSRPPLRLRSHLGTLALKTEDFSKKKSVVLAKNAKKDLLKPSPGQKTLEK